MEGERHYELRSRSRSRSMTPMVLLHNLNDIDVGEHHYDLRSRSRERSYTPAEVTSSRRSGTRSLTGSAGKNSEKAIDVIVESKDTSKVDNAINERRSESAASTNSSRRVERRSERQRVKRQIFSNGQIEKKKDSSDTDKILEKRKSVTPKRTITSDYSSEEGEKEDPPSRPGSAYEIYKQAGDWWNVFPKTDYTYSQTSQFRYEIAPGVLAMPNMSRPSIHSDGNSTSGSVNSLSQQNLSQFSRGTRESHSDSFDVGPEDAMESIEQNRLNEINASRKLSSNSNPDGGAIVYTKHFAQYQSHREIRYGDLNYRVNRRNRYNSGSQIDSDTEIDEALSMRPVGRKRVWKSREWLLKITQTLTIWFYSLLDFTNAKILRRGNNYAASQGYDRYRESNRSKFWETMSRTMHYFYLLLVRILFLDTWLLSRLSSARKQLRNRRSKILWLIFLPPFLLAGLLLASNAPRAVSRFSPKVPDVSQAFGGLGNWISWKSNPSELKKDEIQLETKQLGEESFKSLMAQFAKRLEKLEAADGRKIQDIRDINRAIDDLQKQNLTIWESYNAKLLNIEENMGKNSATSVNEMTSIKLEFQGLREMYGSLKECCDKNAVLGGGEEIEKQVDRVFAGYFGTGVSKHEIKKIIENLMIVENDKNSLMGKVQASTAENSDNTCTGSASLTDEDMRRIVNEILKIYDADKTGRVDYALESAGGQVMSTRCTQRYNVNTRAVKLLGFTLFYESNNPRTVIQGNKLQPGVCWAFTDFPGYILIKLRGPIKVTGFTVEHAPRSILPNKEMKSAPRKFNIWGLTDENDGEPVMFGEYEFQDSDESLQYFPIQNLDITRPYEYVEMRIHSNHGQLEYTCVYRIRVHGVPA